MVVLLCVLLLSLDATLGSSNHENLSRAEQDQGGRMIKVSSSSNGGSSDGTSRRTATRKATKKNSAKSTPTLQTFIKRFPEVNDQSSKEQDHLYMVYKLYLDGAKPGDLEQRWCNQYGMSNYL